jgi:uncharacterized metal-binding protein
MNNIPADFWIKWHHANPMKRLEMVIELTSHMDLVRIANASDIPDDAKARIIGNLLNSYFEDLYYTIFPVLRDRFQHPAQLEMGVKKK